MDGTSADESNQCDWLLSLSIIDFVAQKVGVIPPVDSGANDWFMSPAESLHEKAIRSSPFHPRGRGPLRVRFQESPWDLYVSLVYATGTLGATFSQGTGNPLGVGLAFFLPGYVSVASLYPSNDEIRWAPRLALSLVVSVAIVPFLSLMLNLVNVGLGAFSVSLTVTLYIIVVGLVAYLRRMKLPADRRLSGNLELAWPTGKDFSVLDKLVTIALASCVVVVACFLAYIAVTPRGGEQFTEFYLVGSTGNVSSFPSALNVSQPGTVTIGLVNLEGTITSYAVRVDLIGVQVVYNVTTASNETKDVNRTTWSWINFTLADRESWKSPYVFSISSSGLWKVQFLLFKDGNFSSAYRRLHIFIRVT